MSRRLGAALNGLGTAILVFSAILAGCVGMPSRLERELPAPNWKLSTFDGDTLRSESLAGKVVVLAWIDPTCPEVQTAADGGVLRILERRWMENPRVEIFYVASMGAGTKDWLEPEDWKPWLKDMKLRGTVLVDSAQTLAKAWKIRRIPSAGIVDSKGLVRWAGPIDAMDSTGEPVASIAVGNALEGRDSWVPRRDPEGGCDLVYRTGKILPKKSTP